MPASPKLFEVEQTLVASDGQTYLQYVEEACTITAFGHENRPDWDVFYRPKETKKLTRVGCPLMFPNFSLVKDDIFTECGTHLPKHGIFCREFYDSKMTWTKTAETSDSVTVSAHETEDSMKMYPFKFQLDVTFKVMPKKLVHTWKITNTNSGDMSLPVSPGLHPYFSVAQSDKTSVTLEGSIFDCKAYDWETKCPDDNIPFSGDMTIHIPNKGAIRMRDTSPSGQQYMNMQVWSDKGAAADHDFICFEPVRLGADGLNNKEKRINVPAGQSLTLQCEFEMLI